MGDMEYLDYYDEKGNHLGKATHDEIHSEGWWHKTVNCWLYDRTGNVFLQVQPESKKINATTGHISAGETLEQRFNKEIDGKLGITMRFSQMTLVETTPSKLDKVKADGSVFRDRALSSVFVADIGGMGLMDFNPNPKHTSAVIKMQAADALRVLKNMNGTALAERLEINGGAKSVNKTCVGYEDFTVSSHETGYSKYGKALEKIVELTNK